jgi:hypothetical protein
MWRGLGLAVDVALDSYSSNMGTNSIIFMSVKSRCYWYRWMYSSLTLEALPTSTSDSVVVTRRSIAVAES